MVATTVIASLMVLAVVTVTVVCVQIKAQKPSSKKTKADVGRPYRTLRL
jgi:hypothetical protein